MNDEKAAGGKPDPNRLEALRSLPGEVLDRLTREEVKAFLYAEECPDSLKEKLGDYLVDTVE